MDATPLPPDDHTHSEWSWDAGSGSMDGSCARAAELGLPAIAFTEHVDVTRWVRPPEVRRKLAARGLQVDDDGRFCPPPLDVDGYLAAVDRCRQRFPELRVLTGVELGEPHWFAEEAEALLAGGDFQRVLASLHSIPVDGRPWLVDDLLGPHAPPGVDQAEVLRTYLGEALTMVEQLPGDVQVLAHLDYPVRRWRGRFDPTAFEEEYRAVLAALAATDRVLEVNTRVPLFAEALDWWRDVGGRAVSIASDAHEPAAVANGFETAAAMVEAHGFGPDRDAHGFWHR